jgi:hypothetical protein
MTNVGDVLTALGATAGIAVLLIMALVPLFLDMHQPTARAGSEPVVPVPAQRGPSHLALRVRGRAAHAAGPRA